MESQIDDIYELLKRNAENVSANHWIFVLHEDKFKNLAKEIVELLLKPDTNERYLLIEWLSGEPIINGAKYADTKQDIMDYYNSLPKGLGVEYTVCSIYNVKEDL